MTRNQDKKTEKLRGILHRVLSDEISVKDAVETGRALASTDWSRGYVSALEAILREQKSTRYALKLEDDVSQGELEFYLERFEDLANNRLMRESDRGYFECWHDYAEFLKDRSSDEQVAQQHPGEEEG